MKKDNKQVMNALVLVFQFGINMMIPFFFIGALAGFTNIYKMARKLIEKDSRDDRYVKKDK